MAVFKGAGVALITPFHEDKSVNYEMLGTLIDRQIAGHTDALIVCGTTGEPETLSEEERLQIIRFAVSHAGGRIPVIAGIGGNSTDCVADFAKKTQQLGADALLAVTPYYNKATQNGLYEHYCSVAANTTLPIILYNVPSRTGCNLLPETAVRIALDCPNVTAVKEASGNISQVAQLARLGKDVLDIYSGNDDQIVPVLSLGGAGVISVLANVVPEQVHEMVYAFLEGDTNRARQLQLQYLELVGELFVEVNPIPVKEALNMLGYPVGDLRLPLTRLEERHRASLKRALEKSGMNLCADYLSRLSIR